MKSTNLLFLFFIFTLGVSEKSFFSRTVSIGSETAQKATPSFIQSNVKATATTCSSSDSGSLSFVPKYIVSDEETKKINSWHEEEFKSPLVSLQKETTPIFIGNGASFSGKEYLMTCIDSNEACQQKNALQNLFPDAKVGGELNLFLSIQTFRDLTEPQLLFSAIHQDTLDSIDIWIAPMNDGKYYSTRQVLIGIAERNAVDKTVDTSLMVSTCLNKNSFNTFNFQISADGFVRYYKDGMMLKSGDVTQFPLSSKLQATVALNCNFNFYFGCSPTPNVTCFRGIIGSMTVERNSLTPQAIETKSYGFLNDVFGMESDGICGDGKIGIAEECDDKNFDGNDGCSCDCVKECPDFSPPSTTVTAATDTPSKDLAPPSPYVISGVESGRAVGAYRNIQCAEGYDPITSNSMGNDNVICMVNKQWSSMSLSCVKKCPALNLPAKMKDTIQLFTANDKGDLTLYTPSESDSFSSSSVLIAKCNDNQNSNGSAGNTLLDISNRDTETLTCTDGQWSLPSLICRSTCSSTAHLDKGYVLAAPNKSITHGSSMQIACEKVNYFSSFKKELNQKMVCADGSWSSLNLRCFQSCPAFSSTSLSEGYKLSLAETHKGEALFPKTSTDSTAASSSQDSSATQSTVTTPIVPATSGGVDAALQPGGTEVGAVQADGSTGDGAATTSTSTDKKGPVSFIKSWSRLVSKDAANLFKGSTPDGTVPHGSYMTIQCDDSYYSTSNLEQELVYCNNGKWGISSIQCIKECDAFALEGEAERYSVSTLNSVEDTKDTAAVVKRRSSKQLQQITCADGYTSGTYYTTSVSSVSTSVDANGNPTDAVVTTKKTRVDSEILRCSNAKWEKQTLFCKKKCDTFALEGDDVLRYTVSNIGETTGTEHGAMKKLVCSIGYTPYIQSLGSGGDASTVSETIQCEDGKWSDISLKCKKNCPLFYSADQLRGLRPDANIKVVSGEGEKHGDKRVLECDTSQDQTIASIDSTVQQETVHCVDGEWEIPTMTCRKSCPALSLPNTIVVENGSVSHGSTRSLSCASGYKNAYGFDKETVTCRNGSWSPYTISCIEGCGAFPALSTQYSTTTVVEGSQLNASRVIRCASNSSSSTATQEQTITCQLGSSNLPEWSKVTLVCGAPCSKYTIDSSYEVSGDKYSVDDTREGTKLTVRCANGYYSMNPLVTSATATCIHSQWTPHNLMCMKPCSQASLSYPRIQVEAGDLSPGSLRTVKCVAGYKDTLGRENETISCLFGNWKAPTLDCRLSCPAPKTVFSEDKGWTVDLLPETSQDEEGNYIHGSKIAISCEKSLSVSVNMPMSQESVCRDGQWTDVSLRCWKKCDTPLQMNTDAYVVKYVSGSSEGEMLHGATRGISCAPGYQAERGEDSVWQKCINGSWTQMNLKCRKKCGDPGASLSSRYSVTGASKPEYSHGERMKIGCNATAGFASPLGNGQDEIVCSEGSWSSPGLVCESFCGAYQWDEENKNDFQILEEKKFHDNTFYPSPKSYANGDSIKIACADGYAPKVGSSNTQLLSCLLPKCSVGKKSASNNEPSPSLSNLDSASVSSDATINGGAALGDAAASGNLTPATETANGDTSGVAALSSTDAGAALSLDVGVTAPSSNTQDASAVNGGNSSSVASSSFLQMREEDFSGCIAQWSDRSLTCEKKCTDFVPPTGKNYSVRKQYSVNETDNSVLPGSSLILSCVSPGVDNPPQQELTCYQGEWSSIHIECPQNCPDPFLSFKDTLLAKHLSITTPPQSIYSNGDSLHLECSENYSPAFISSQHSLQSDTMVCYQGKWSLPALQCEKSCPAFQIDTSIYKVDPSTKGIAFGAERIITCANNLMPVIQVPPLYRDSTPEAREQLIANGNLPKKRDPGSSEGFQNVKCLSGGVWSPLTMECELPCSPWEKEFQTNYQEGYLYTAEDFNSVTNTLPLDGVTITCDVNQGYLSTSGLNSQVVRCSGGRWSERSLFCRKACKTTDLPSPLLKDPSLYQLTFHLLNGQDSLSKEASSDASAGTDVDTPSSVPADSTASVPTLSNTEASASGSGISQQDTLGPAPTSLLQIRMREDRFEDMVFPHASKINVQCSASGSPQNVSAKDASNDLYCRDGKWSSLTVHCTKSCPAFELPSISVRSLSTVAAPTASSEATPPTSGFLQAKASASFVSLSQEVVTKVPTAIVINQKDETLQHGTWRELSCNQSGGFRSQAQIKSQKVFCIDGQWQQNTLQCTTSCEPYSLPSDANKQQKIDNRYVISPIDGTSSSQAQFNIGEGFTISCSAGYASYRSLLPKENVLCGVSGWSQLKLRCRRPLVIDWSSHRALSFVYQSETDPGDGISIWRGLGFRPLVDTDPTFYRALGDSYSKAVDQYPSGIQMLVGGEGVKAARKMKPNPLSVGGRMVYLFDDFSDTPTSTDGSSYPAENYKCLGEGAADSTTGLADLSQYQCVVEECVETITSSACSTCERDSTSQIMKWKDGSSKTVLYSSPMWWLFKSQKEVNEGAKPPATFMRVKWSCIETCPTFGGWKLPTAVANYIYQWSGGECECTELGCKDTEEKIALANLNTNTNQYDTNKPATLVV